MNNLQPSKMRESADAASELLAAAANRNRLMILCHLVNREVTVTELMELVGMSQSAMSQQLAKLRAANLVATRRNGQQIYYSLASEKVEQLLQLIYGMYCMEETQGLMLKKA
ncbi:MAG: transcriptional regulator [Hoeflea sp.]|nr:transcriptional regulator [Hoeflea sp.]|tara:strand:- start:20066 stop:20401 length:336 start_codon:yes stop_codon:yes gene_type:complete